MFQNKGISNNFWFVGLFAFFFLHFYTLYPPAKNEGFKLQQCSKCSKFVVMSHDEINTIRKDFFVLKITMVQ